MEYFSNAARYSTVIECTKCHNLKYFYQLSDSPHKYELLVACAKYDKAQKVTYSSSTHIFWEGQGDLVILLANYDLLA